MANLKQLNLLSPEGATSQSEGKFAFSPASAGISLKEGLSPKSGIKVRAPSVSSSSESEKSKKISSSHATSPHSRVS